MKRLDLDPTDENVRNSILNDSLERNKHIKTFYELLRYSEDIHTIAIDGAWGSGKTFFAKELCQVINNCAKDNVENEIKKVIGIENPDTSICAVYYDAWKNDNDLDPVVSILLEIADQLEEIIDISDIKKSLNSIIGEICKTVLNKYISLTLKINASLQVDDPLKNYKESKTFEGKIKQVFNELTEEHCNKLIIFIDELDRCKPTYAVELLERIKHYFTDDRLIFVFTINSSQLQHSIKKCYGNEFDAYNYLDRFFDLRLNLPLIKREKIYEIVEINNDVPSCVMKTIINYYSMEFRQISHYKLLCNVVNNKFLYKKEIGPFSAMDNMLSLYLAPLFIGVFLNNKNDYDSLITGNNSKLFSQLLSRVESIDDLWSDLNCFNNEENKKSKMENASLLYEAIFKEYSWINNSKRIGSYTFTERTKNRLFEIISLLSDISIFTSGGEDNE